MNERRYTQVVRREFLRLSGLAFEREADSRLKEIVTTVNRWKKGGTGSADALAEIKHLSAASPIIWTEGVDPGVPVAHAVAAGFLTRSDFTDSAWKAIEVLVTVAEI